MTTHRVPRNTRIDPTDVRLIGERVNKERYFEMAESAGYSASGLFDALVENMPLDESGAPAFLPKRAESESGELPIDGS